MKPYNRMTIKRDGSGPVVGDAAEKHFRDMLAQHEKLFLWTAEDKGDFDFVTITDFFGETFTIDVKCKERKKRHSVQDDAHVTQAQQDYEVDAYFFYSGISDDSQQYGFDLKPMGWCMKDEFWKNAKRVKEGDVDGVYRERADAGKLKYEALRNPDDLLTHLQGCDDANI